MTRKVREVIPADSGTAGVHLGKIGTGNGFDTPAFVLAVKQIVREMLRETTLTKAIKSGQSPADRKWGYEFGVDGLMTPEEAQAWLGNISRRTLGRRMAQGKIRRGFDGHKVVLCRRSVMQHAREMEL